MRITFTDTYGVDEKYAPIPATKTLPDWYKKTPEYLNGRRVVTDGHIQHTIKKCIPVFDCITAGYIIPTYVDVQVTQRDEVPWYEWRSHDAISFHPVEQASGHPSMNGVPYPKWNSPWSIRTPRGYSCMYLPPMHNPNGIFTILPGIVDTDRYATPVNFPFVLDDPKWEGLIPAGTPIVQVIPFRRDSFTMEIGGLKERESQNKATVRLRSVWFNSYKRQFWARKEYR